MSTDIVIKKLVDDLKPIQAQARPLAFAAWIFPVLILTAVVVILYFGVQEDISGMWAESSFVLVLGCATILSFFGLFSVAELSSPGIKSKSLGWTIVLVLVPFVVYLLKTFTSDDSVSDGLGLFGMKCVQQVMLSTVLSYMILLLVIRRRISTRPVLAGICTSFAALSVGWVAICFICGYDNSTHILIYHLLVPGTLTLILGSLGAWSVLKI